MKIAPLKERVEERIRAWNVVVQDTLETPSSYLVFGTCSNRPVVLKVIRQPGDEWRCGEILKEFDGKGTVRVLQYSDGAVLLERLHPGTMLAEISLNGRDQEATAIIAEVIKQMSSANKSGDRFVTVADWGRGFQWYLASGDNRISRELVMQGQQLYAQLCASQQTTRLLHGDLQHYNILFDDERGWVAIDPKGVIGETEYEIGASLRNPNEKPELFTCAQAVERRLMVYEDRLQIDFNRALAWGFAQAVLSAIWTIEDGFELTANNPAILLAKTIQPMLK